MVKQEKIREGMASIPSENCTPMTQEQCDSYVETYGERKACDYCHTDQTIAYLHSQGVVIYKAGHREYNFEDEVVEPLIGDKNA